MQILSTAGKLDWNGWFLGIMGAIVSGAAGAIGAFVGVETVLDVGLQQTVYVMLVTAGFSALISLGKYLQMQPTPKTIVSQVKETTEVTKTTETTKTPEVPPTTGTGG